jgi:hypothetical protein
VPSPGGGLVSADIAGPASALTARVASAVKAATGSEDAEQARLAAEVEEDERRERVEPTRAARAATRATWTSSCRAPPGLGSGRDQQRPPSNGHACGEASAWTLQRPDSARLAAETQTHDLHADRDVRRTRRRGLRRATALSVRRWCGVGR